MREDTFTSTVADAGRYDYATFPQPGPTRAWEKPVIPVLACGHDAVKVDGEFSETWCVHGCKDS